MADPPGSAAATGSTARPAVGLRPQHPVAETATAIRRCCGVLKGRLRTRAVLPMHADGCSLVPGSPRTAAMTACVLSLN